MSATTSNDFRFNLSVSLQGYGTKPTKEQVPKITFSPRYMTIDDALQCATEGRAFCYAFFTPNQDGIIAIKDKTEKNFLSTSTVIYDFDDMTVPMLDYIESLPYKPSFAYPTYSDGKNGYSRYRLAYVFNTELWGVQEFNTMYQAIANANQFVKETKEHGGWDKRNVSQLYYGTTSGASAYNGHRVYSFADFEPYAVPCTEIPKVSATKTKDYSKYESVIDADFLYDFTNLPQKALYTKYRDMYYSNYEQSLSTPLKLDETGMFYTYPDDYVCVNHKRKGKYTYKWEIGEDRKKKLYITAQIMLFNLPTLTRENLLYNLTLERQWYYDNTDGKIDKQFLLQTAINAYNKPYALEPSKHGAFTLNKEYWEGKQKTANQAKMIVRGLLKQREVKRLYNPTLSLKQNRENLIKSGIQISLRTLQRMVSGGDIKIISFQAGHTYLSSCPDSDTIRICDLIDHNCNVKQAGIAAALGISLPTVKRYMAAMKGKFIYREGDSRSGHWLVKHPLPWKNEEQDEDSDSDGWQFVFPEFEINPDRVLYSSYLQ